MELSSMFLIDKRKLLLSSANLLIFVNENELDVLEKQPELHIYKVSNQKQFEQIETGYIYIIDVIQDKLIHYTKMRKKEIAEARYHEIIAINDYKVNGARYSNTEIKEIYTYKFHFMEKAFYWSYILLKSFLSIIFIMPGALLASLETSELSQILYILAFFPWFFFYLIVIFHALDKPIFKFFPVLQRYTEKQNILLGRRIKQLSEKEMESAKDFNRRIFLFCTLVSLGSLVAAFVVGS